MKINDETIWVLHTCNKLSVGGVQAFLMNYYKNMDRDKIQFAFVVQRDFSYPYDKEIEEMGGRVHKVSSIKDLKKYSRELNDLFKQHPEYKIVHSHMHNRNAIPLYIAKKNNIPIRISHAHNTGVPMSFATKMRFNIMKGIIKLSATHFFACTSVAGNYLHGQNKTNYIVKNAIDLEKFKYNESIRKIYRGYLNLNDETLIGHIGNFTPQKNYYKILNIFKELPDNFKLVLIGTGNDVDKIKNKIDTYKITDRVILTGEKSDVSNYLQAMDLFLFPSLFEGLGIVAIEAQASGLPTLISSNVPDDACITNNCVMLDLEESDKTWAEIIKKCINNTERSSDINKIADSGYDISHESISLMKKYKMLSEISKEKTNVNTQKIK